MLHTLVINCLHAAAVILAALLKYCAVELWMLVLHQLIGAPASVLLPTDECDTKQMSVFAVCRAATYRKQQKRTLNQKPGKLEVEAGGGAIGGATIYYCMKTITY
jgi:hypothetical protein